jgi:hypothetical protein
MNSLEENCPRGRDRSPARTRQALAMFAKCFEAIKQEANQEYYDLAPRHGEKLTFYRSIITVLLRFRRKAV